MKRTQSLHYAVMHDVTRILFSFPNGIGSHAERSEAWSGKAHGSRTALTVAHSGISRATARGIHVTWSRRGELRSWLKVPASALGAWSARSLDQPELSIAQVSIWISESYAKARHLYYQASRQRIASWAQSLTSTGSRGQTADRRPVRKLKRNATSAITSKA